MHSSVASLLSPPERCTHSAGQSGSASLARARSCDDDQCKNLSRARLNSWNRYLEVTMQPRARSPWVGQQAPQELIAYSCVAVTIAGR